MSVPLKLISPVGYLGRRAKTIVGECGVYVRFFILTVTSIFSGGYEMREVVIQLRHIGARSITVICFSGMFIGMVVAVQFYDTLVRFGSVSLLGSAVGLSLIRELGPVVAALMIIARSGSAMCAELAIMRTEQQIDALTCMAIDPLPYLITPRFIAVLIAVPLLTAIMIAVGILGGWIIGGLVFNIGYGTYFIGMADTVGAHDLAMGFIKSVAFAGVIIWIAAAKGFLIHRDTRSRFGAAGISQVTTEAVVLSAIFVLFVDYVISSYMV